MGRRRKSSTADDLMDLVALLPWWAGVALAVVSYWVLNGVATRPLPVVQTGQQITAAVPAMLWQGLSTGGQYLIPFICLMGALASFLRRRKRTALFETASQASGADVLQGMSWQEFEMLVGEGFKRRGYGVRETGGGGADGGMDLVLINGSERFFVQCKQWKAFRVGVSTVRELYGVMAAERATGGFVVTSGRFTQDAHAFASGRNIHLIDGAQLIELLNQNKEESSALKPNFPSASTIAATTAQPSPLGTADLQTRELETPNCPKCGKPMARRVAQKGSTMGQHFWGCSNFRNGCRGTRKYQKIDPPLRDH